MTPTRLLSVFAALLAASAQAQVLEGEILLNTYGTSGGQCPGLWHYRPDGTLVSSATSGSANRWSGAAIDTNGNWLTTYRVPSRIATFSPDGVELSVVPTPEVQTPYALGVFADGTIAVSDQTGDVELYTPAGTHVATYTAPGLVQPLTPAIDATDELWVSDYNGSSIHHLGRDGTPLGTIDVGTEEVSGIDFASDGSLWTVVYNTGLVRHYSRDGALLGTIFTGVGGVGGIAVGLDGTLWLTGIGSNALFNYGQDGTLLSQFPIPCQGSTSITIPKGVNGTRYCSPAIPNSSGAPARITLSGTRIVLENDLTLTATDLPTGEFGYFLVGSNQGVFMPPGSQGNLCLTCGFQGCAGIGRFNQAGSIIVGPTGSIDVDLTALPLSPPRAVVAGENWNFQCWFRDLGSSNFTDAVSVLFL
ncbi:MAG: hypothetical protein GY711_12270 [bacterium]|nr:hypothetical protein [bacterium]